MAILVTGGAGFIGSHTCVSLTQAGYEVIIVDNYYNSSPKSLARINELCGKALKLYECDIRDKAGMDKIFKENKIEAVIHFAGLKAVGESCRKPIEYYDNNIGGTLVLCDVMRVQLVGDGLRHAQCFSLERNDANRRHHQPLRYHQIYD